MNKLRTLIILGGAILLAMGLQLLLYGLYITYETVSNITFVLGIITFFSSLIALTGAFEVMYGIRFALRTLYDWSYREKVKTIGEYRDSKTLKKENKSTVYKEIMVVSILLLVTAAITGGLAI